MCSDNEICRFKIDIRNLTNFDLSTWVSKIYTWMGCFWRKYIVLQLESTDELRLMALKIDTEFEGKLSCTSKNDIKSQNWDFDNILLFKVENVWA